MVQGQWRSEYIGPAEEVTEKYRENWATGKIFSLRRREWQRWKKIHNTKLNNLYSSCPIVTAIIPRKATREEHVARIKKIKMHTLNDREGEKVTMQQARAPRSRPISSDWVAQHNNLSVTAIHKHYKHIKNSGLQYIWCRPPRIHKMENSVIKTSIITITNQKSIYRERQKITVLLQC